MKQYVKHIKLVNITKFLVLLCLFSSCGSTKKNAATQSSIESEPKIIFLNYSIKKNLNTTRSVHFISKIIADGKFKNTTAKEKENSGDLECLQLDKKSKTLQRIIIKNPLSKTIEFVDDSKSFQTKTIDLDSTQFSLRLQLKPNTKYISIFELGGKQTNSNPLITTKLN